MKSKWRVFRENVVYARNHIAFIVGLILAFSLIYHLTRLDESLKMERVHVEITHPPAKFTTGNLTSEDLKIAKIAWKYFENNYQPSTGLVNSVDGFHSTTLWDTGNYLLALISAHEIGIVSDEEFRKRVDKLLTTFYTMPLFEGKLPNKSYDTLTGKMTDYEGHLSEKGIGWSAIDIGRISIPLFILLNKYPEFTEKIHKILQRWDLDALAKNGVLVSGKPKNGKLQILQEGRLGYEQFAAKMLFMLSLDVIKSLDYREHLSFTKIFGIDIPYDVRDLKNSGANNYVLSEPYMLDGLEFGWDFYSSEFAYRIYKVQEKRFKETGIPTAMTEDHIDQPPWFIYNCIFVNGKPWQAITDKGEVRNDLRTLSTKAAFAWYVLYPNDYTRFLYEKIKDNYNPEKGWYAGIYEKSGRINKSININTNAIVLESIFFKKVGPLVIWATRKE